MRIERLPLLLLALGALVTPGVRAQTSASYKLQEHVLNAGGHPRQGIIAASPSFHVTLDAVGVGIRAQGLSSGSYHASGGFVGPRKPPGEVQALTVLADKQTLQWNWEPASTAFNVYRDGLGTLPSGFGTCQASRIARNSWPDAGIPPAGTGWFYLVTGENELWEEGTLGFESSGTERPNTAPCP